MKLNYRDVVKEDISFICKLPENEAALFYMFPKASYPLSSDQLEKVHNERVDPTVFLEDEKIIGYANIYLYEDEDTPYIGHVVLDRNRRGKGYGKFILKTMVEKAFKRFDTKTVRLAVFRDNAAVYNLYKSFGFKIFKVAIRKDHKDEDRVLIFMEYKG